MEEFLRAVEGDDIDTLDNLIRRPPSLETLAHQWNGYTPLHVACAAGRVTFVQRLLTTNIGFADEKGTDGLSPMHIAAARGHDDVVREVLRSHPQLCFVKGLEDRMPLHYAIENGKLNVMIALLDARPRSIEETTSQKETALHLALKNDQFDLVNDLVKYVKQHNKEVINFKDNEGNTALHFAVAAKNFEVVNFMLEEHAKRYVVLDVDAQNNRGKTPLDCLGRYAGDENIRKIRRILIEAGAKHGKVTHSSPVLEEESKADMRNALLVVAALIVSATYQSVLQPPRFKIEVDKTHTEGFPASYASYMTGFFGRDLAYIVFITGNTFGLLVSVQMIICLTRDLSVRLPMLLSMILMVQTYYCHTYYLPFGTLEKEFGLINAELLSVLPLMIPILLLLFQRQLALALEFYLEKLSLFDHLRDMYHILA